jgi:hypothetical protein
MEESLGRKIEEYDDKINDLLEKYETYEERKDRRARSWFMFDEMAHLTRLDAAAEYWEGRRESEKHREKEKIIEDKRRERLRKENECNEIYPLERDLA